MSLYGPIKTPGKLYILFHSRSTERFLHTMRYWFTHILWFCILIVSFFSSFKLNSIKVYFFFGLVICLFQLAFLILFVLSVLHKKLSSNGEVDNPDDGLLAQFVHSDADPLVRATQILAIISYSLFAESSLQDVVTGTFCL